MSRTPVREALIRLANEGLVEVVPRHGMRVLPVSAADMDEIYRVSAASRRPRPRSSPSAGPGRGAEAARGRDARDGRARSRPTISTPGRPPTSASTGRWSSSPATACWPASSTTSGTARTARGCSRCGCAPKPTQLDPRAPAMLVRAIRARRRSAAPRAPPRAPRARAHRAHRHPEPLPSRPPLGNPMTASRSFDICVLPGDGIGAEVIDATLPLLERLAHGAAFGFAFSRASRPARCTTRPPATRCPRRRSPRRERADAILFGAMGWPEIRYPDGTEIAPQLDLRVALELYAGVRPARAHSRRRAAARRPAGARHRPRASCASRPRACSPRAARA